jgi:hypothetical protein
MAENSSATAWNVDAPEDTEFINRIPEEMRFLREAVESIVEDEHTIVETGDVITSVRHKLGAARVFMGSYGTDWSNYPSTNPAGNVMSTSIDTGAVDTCELGRIAIGTDSYNLIKVYAEDADGTAVWTGVSVDHQYATINGVSSQVFVKYFTGTTDADSLTEVAHGVTGIDNILHVSAAVFNGVTYEISDFRSAVSDAALKMDIYFDGTNVTLACGTSLQSQKYRVKIDYLQP